MDIEPLKGLSDSEEGGGDSSPSVEGEEFGTTLAIGVAIFLFFLFTIGAMKG